MEGRIQAFPRESWALEFPRAAAAAFDAIEWIYDVYGAGANPIDHSEGIAGIRALSLEHKIAVRSLCADYFMKFLLVRAAEVENLIALIARARQIGVTRIVLPFVDTSAISNAADCDGAVDALTRALPAARAASIELHLETSLCPDQFRALLARVPDPLVKVNYDSGNSAANGYKPADEFAAYGGRIGGVHIKDRVLGGGTVPLGEGDADLDGVFTGLRLMNYSGDFVLQVARGTAGEEIEWARRNREFVARYLG